MCRTFMMVIACLVSLIACADEGSPVVKNSSGIPLAAVLEQRLARTDKLMQDIAQRPVEPTDKQFIEVIPNYFVRSIQRTFPECVPSMELLLDHADLRIRFVALKLLAGGIDSQRKESTKLDSEASTRLRRRCMSIMKDTAHEKLSPVFCESVADLFVKLTNKQVTEEENQSLKELLSSEVEPARKAALHVLLAVQTSGPDEVLCQHVEKCFQSDSAFDKQWIVQRICECPSVSAPLRETICRALRREPNMNGTKSLALLLAKTNPVPTEAIPGLVQAMTQSVPRAGGMCCLPQSSAIRQLILNEQQIAGHALNNVSHTDITAVPMFLVLLDHPQLEVRRQGVIHLRQFGSLALGALPKLLTMDTRNECWSLFQSLGDLVIQFEKYSAVGLISLDSILQLNGPRKYEVMFGAAYVALMDMQHAWHISVECR